MDDYNENDLIGNDATLESYSDMGQKPMSGAVKFGYVLLGFFLNLTALLIAWLINDGDKERVKQSVLFSLIGVGANWILSLLAATIIFGMLMMLAGASAGDSTWYNYKLY